MARSSTPGQRARLYLEAHRDARTTALPGEHKQAREDIMRQLEHQDPSVRERALVGSDQHFDRPLTNPEKVYQQHWRREEGIDVGTAIQRRRELEGGHEGRRRAATPKRPTTRPAPRQRAASYVRQTAQAAQTVTPAPVRGGLGVFYGALAAGIGFAMLYLLLSRPGAATGLLNFGGGSFRRLISAQVPLFGPAPNSSATAAVNQYLQTDPNPAAGPAPAPAAVGAATAAGYDPSKTFAQNTLNRLRNTIAHEKIPAGYTIQTDSSGAQHLVHTGTSGTAGVTGTA